MLFLKPVNHFCVLVRWFCDLGVHYVDGFDVELGHGDDLRHEVVVDGVLVFLLRYQGY